MNLLKPPHTNNAGMGLLLELATASLHKVLMLLLSTLAQELLFCPPSPQSLYVLMGK